ncbi:MAG TPA: cohesin domain-containing protein [Candidatus Woesebacteria bacterium]|nr:cohesin domain-containing protein [Candidatus Woesebacteria bacterium]
MKKIIRNSIAYIVAFIFFLNAGVIYAATFNFNPTSTYVRPDNTFKVDINVDAGSDQIAGTDIYISYDSSIIEVETITDGTYFPQVEDVPTAGRLYISGFVNTQGDYKTGSGNIASITFKALQTGTTSLVIDCDPSITDTSKIVQNDTAVTNILDCSTLTAHPVTVSADAPDNGTGGTTSTGTGSTPTELPQSGVVEDMITFAIWGGVLVGLGAVLRIILRII